MQREAAFPRSFLCVPKAPVLQTVWVQRWWLGWGVVEAGSVADVAAGQNQLAV